MESQIKLTTSLFVFLTLFPLFQCHCRVFSPKPDGKPCVYKGTTVQRNATEYINCMRCTCYENGLLDCCSVSGRLKYPKYCIEVQDGPCHSRAVMRHDHSIPCDKVATT